MELLSEVYLLLQKHLVNEVLSQLIPKGNQAVQSVGLKEAAA